jgi:glycosyltransferase involved in cell wall biosynthesis
VSTLVNLEELRSALARFGTRRRVVLRVIGNQPPDRPFENVENVFVPWQEAGEAETIGQGHVGVMPLPDDPFMRGKCGLKALQYMAVGLPVLASPVGVNSEIIESGANGLLATTQDEWVDALDSLARSRALRDQLAAAGRRTVEERYSSEIAAAMFARAVKN